MSRPIAAALVLAAMALLASASAIAQAAPAPGELWSEFPLEPVTATTPAGLAPAQGGEQPVQPQDTAAGTDARTEWVVLLLGAVAAGAAGLVTRHRRSAKRQQPGPEGERKQERAVVHTFERAVSSRASDRGTGSVMIKGRTRTRTATQPTLIATLSPQGRLADQLDGSESEAEPETHQVCEIACWRGYVTWQFYVESADPLEPAYSSPYFRAPGKGAPEQSDIALQAHVALVERLVAAGWEPEGYGEEWFSERFQRLI
jgi:hypothetical protein